MSTMFRKVGAGVTIAALLFAMPVSNVHAGPFLDWLLGRPILTYPSTPTAAVPTATPAVVTSAIPGTVTAAYPTTAVTAPVAPLGTITTGYPTAGAVAAPAVAYPTTPIATQPVAVVQRRGLGLAPAYRTSWLRVPVTQYRPVTAYQGVGAQPVTVMQPCNTSILQPRRVPFLFQHRPWLPAQAATAVPYAAAYPAATAAACPCPTTTAHVAPAACPTTAATVAPYYAAPATTTIPSTTIPSTSIPSTIAPQTPSGLAPVPADQAPSLNSTPAAVPYSASTTPAPLQSSPNVATQQSGPSAASSVYQVKPIPDPAAREENSNSPRGLAPPLLNSRERTAAKASPRPAAVQPAVWKTPVKSQGAAPQAAAPQPHATAKPQLWDDNGWRSAKSW